MKDFELKTLIFNDGEKFRSFQSEDFNFILDKNSGISICYGESQTQTPTYDPLSPEIIDINFKSYKNETLYYTSRTQLDKESGELP